MTDPASPVAILYQAVESPLVDGVRKPVKPGGYSDSGADMAVVLRTRGVPVLTPSPEPDPARALDWVYPDTREGIHDALAAGAQVLWANTVLFEGHPLQKVQRPDVRIVGQRPERVQFWDDKWLANRRLAAAGLPIARAILVGRSDLPDVVPLDVIDERRLAEAGLAFPLVVKPVRGRGSEGVARVADLDRLKAHARGLLAAVSDGIPTYGAYLILEEYLDGTEVTITVMPAGSYLIDGREVRHERPWCLPPVRRFNHADGVAPYNGIVAVTNNSVVLTDREQAAPPVRQLLADCVDAATLVEPTAPIRIDCRQDRDGRFRLFDLNMKPNMTGPGRPGRDDQDSLSSMAARAIGWSYGDLLDNMLRQGWAWRELLDRG